MKFDTSTPRANFTVAGTQYTIPQPFKEGHTVNANEAAALNQLLVENARNNLAGRVKPKDSGNKDAEGKPIMITPDPLTQADVDKYVSEYDFGVRRAGATMDPVEREARNLAWELVKGALAKRNIPLKDVDADAKNAYIDQALAKRGDELRKKAAQVVKARQSVSADETDILEL